MRRLLCEFAQAARTRRCALKAKFESLAIRKGHKKSIVALAHKMLRTIYAILASGAYYPRQEHQLRSAERDQKCPALDQDAVQARLHR